MLQYSTLAEAFEESRLAGSQEENCSSLFELIQGCGQVWYMNPP